MESKHPILSWKLIPTTQMALSKELTTRQNEDKINHYGDIFDAGGE